MAMLKKKRCAGCRMVLIDYVDLKRGKCGSCAVNQQPHPWKKER